MSELVHADEAEHYTSEMQQMMQLAIRQGTDGVEALRALVELKREQEDREAAREFAAALARFHRIAPKTIRKDRTGAHGARYATLDQIMQTIMPALLEAGLSVSYDTESQADAIAVQCIIRHVGGHSERTLFTCPREAPGKRMNVAQAEGSALMYARRYALSAALNLVTGDRDDDGHAAGSAPTVLVTAEQAADLRALATEIGIDQAEFFAAASGYIGSLIDTFAAVPADKYNDVVSALEGRR